MSEIYEFQGPKRGADRAVLLAHGAGADMHAAALTTVADALAAAKVPSLRFNFPYKAAGRRSPDRPPVLEASVRDAIKELTARTKLGVDRLVLGGRSMGGRICSMVAATDGALGLALLGYPLHPPGKPDALRVDHFPRLRMPVLFASGTRDPFGTPDELRAHAKAIKGRVSFHWVDTGDHGFKPL
ncbi:MAG TPA: alpha/beta family hydrolase, partial [Acidimicrobiia bacterium]|nr:alpha/beta family hydrolase [Acidimicrobiia bacterium]